MNIKTAAAVGIALLAALMSGCATKNYGRQGELTDFERRSLECREIELETAKVHGFLAHVEKESQFDGRSVLSFLGDFGIGNVMEKNHAVQSANTRLSQLQNLRTQKGCGASPQTSAAAAPPGVAGTAAPAPASTASSLGVGQEEFQVRDLARQQGCNTQPVPTLVGKAPGQESYAVACSNGEALMVRCEFSQCRVLK